jgi:hypothetical protein
MAGRHRQQVKQIRQTKPALGDRRLGERRPQANHGYYHIAERWFSLPNLFYLLPVPLLVIALSAWLWRTLGQ